MKRAALLLVLCLAWTLWRQGKTTTSIQDDDDGLAPLSPFPAHT